MTQALYRILFGIVIFAYLALMSLFVFAIVLYFINYDALIAVLLWARLTFLYP